MMNRRHVYRPSIFTGAMKRTEQLVLGHDPNVHESSRLARAKEKELAESHIMPQEE